MKTVTRKDWKNRPMPERRSQIAVDREFSMGEMERIKRGYLPAEMEEKWFIYFSRNRLYLHRSWTGFCVFIAHFKRKQDSFVLQLIEANRDDAQYSQKDDVYDAQLCLHLIDLLLLGRETLFPTTPGVSPEQAAVRQWTEAGKVGSGGTENEDDEDGEDQEPESPTGQSKSNTSGFATALEQAAKPNYLGDPAVVEGLLRQYAMECVARLVDGKERLEAAKIDWAEAAKLADILLGKSPEYPSMAGWNKPGIIDRWLVDQTQVLGDTAEERVARTLVIYLCRMYDLLVQSQNDPQDSDQILVDAIVQEFTLVLMGSPEWNSME